MLCIWLTQHEIRKDDRIVLMDWDGDVANYRHFSIFDRIFHLNVRVLKVTTTWATEHNWIKRAQSINEF